LLAAGTLLSLVVVPSFGATSTDGQDFSQIERGRYLARAADCTACHTLPDAQPFAGGRAIETPFGNITAPNITPDLETGIGAWTDDEFDNAVRDGIRPDGARLYPAMPYTSYTKMSRGDVMAIRAYLNTVAPVRNPVVADTLPFPFNIRLVMRVWNALYFTGGEFKPDGTKSAEWNRGAYLVEGPGHCAVCHTPKSPLGGDETNQYLSGANLQGWFAPDITNDNGSGLGRWSVQDITAYLRTGHNRTTAATGPMAEEIAHSSSQMTDGDLVAIATYLKSLPGRQNSPVPVQGSDPAMVAGQAIYRDQCSACHALDGRGIPQLFPSLADSAMVRSSDPTTLIRILLRGAQSVATKGEPTSPGMPPYAWQLNDAQVAAVLTYIRNAWTPTAPPVMPRDVNRVRSDPQAQAD
jgi:mono/diheme cytochrome c family protein